MADDSSKPKTESEFDPEKKRLTKWSVEPSLQDLKADLEAAQSSHSEMTERIRRWRELHASRPREEKVRGRSKVESKLIRRNNEWRYPALSEPFLNATNFFSVSPYTHEDAAAARQNELLINWQFRTQINRTRLIDDFVRAVVDEGTGILRLGWERQTRVTKEEVPVFEHYPIQGEEELAALQQLVELKTQSPQDYEQVPPELQAAVDYFEETGEPTSAVMVGTEMEEVEEILVNRPTVDVLDPLNVYMDPTCNGDLDRALFVVVSFETNKANLQKDGKRYKNLDKVNWDGNSTLTNPSHNTNSPDTFNFADAARKKVVAYEYWGFYDIKGKGELTPIVATWIGDVLIRLEENPYPDGKLPFVVVPYLPIKRGLYGEPDAEMLEDNQRIQGAVLRGVLDLLGRSANSQQGFAKNMLDPYNRRRFENGQDYEFNPNINPQQGIITHTYPEIPQSALTLLGMQDQEAEALSGSKAFSGGLSGSAYGNVATGIRGMLDAAAKREMSILRRLVQGITEVGRKIISMNSEFLSDTEVIRVTNSEYVTITREELRGEFHLVVDISTTEIDETRAQDLGFMLQTIGPNMDPGINMMILAEIAKLKRMPELENQLRSWEPPPPDEMQQQLQQMEVAKLQAEIEKIQSEAQLNAARAAKLQAEADYINLKYVEQETGTTHERDMARQEAQARGNQKLAITKALTKSLKAGETAPDIEEAIGYNAMSDLLDSVPSDDDNLEEDFENPGQGMDESADGGIIPDEPLPSGAEVPDVESYLGQDPMNNLEGPFGEPTPSFTGTPPPAYSREIA